MNELPSASMDQLGAESAAAFDYRLGPPNRPAAHLQVTRNVSSRQHLIHGRHVVGRLGRGAPQATRAGGPVLFDVASRQVRRIDPLTDAADALCDSRSQLGRRETLCLQITD